MAYIGNTAEQQAFTPRVDYFSGNASATAFTLSFPVASVAQVQAVIENVPQAPGDAYTVSGNTITFTSAPPSGTNNIYVYYTSPITQVIQPGQGTVGTAQLQSGVTVNFADGSASTPSITNDGDTNTGIFFPAADTIAFAEGGAEVARFDSTGNLGIGTSSPAAKLDVDGIAVLVGTKTASSGLGGNIRMRNDTGTVQWTAGILGGVGATDWSVFNNVSSAIHLNLTTSGNFQFNSGYGSAATAYGCRAWVNCAGNGSTGTNQTIRGSGNVSSVAHPSSGVYLLNFSSEMPDTNYSVVGMATSTTTAASATDNQTVSVYNYATGSFNFYVSDASANTFQNSGTINIAVFR
jgi:hypothetical protein